MGEKIKRRVPRRLDGARHFFLGGKMGVIPTPQSPHFPSSPRHLTPRPPSRAPPIPTSRQHRLGCSRKPQDAFSPILRCLPYFSPNRRPTRSQSVLEAFSSMGGGDVLHHPDIPISPSPNTPPIHLSRPIPLRMLYNALGRVFAHPKVFALLFSKNAS